MKNRLDHSRSLKTSGNKHSNVLIRIGAHETEGISNVENILSLGSYLALRELITYIKSQDGERVAVTITKKLEELLATLGQK